MHELDDFYAQLDAWRDWVYPRAKVVSVDSFLRDNYLIHLGETLGVNFETDWTPVNVSSDAGITGSTDAG